LTSDDIAKVYLEEMDSNDFEALGRMALRIVPVSAAT
jgi:hypothetical protein